MTVTLLSVGLLGFLLLFLGAYVVAGRVKFKVDNGDGGNPVMRQRIRAQANFVEYVPLALILLVLVEKESIGPRWLAVSLSAVLVVARLWHAQGMLIREETSVGRFMGTT